MSWSDAARAAAAASRRRNSTTYVGTASGRNILARHIRLARYNSRMSRKTRGHGVSKIYASVAKKHATYISGLRRHYHMSPMKGGY